MIRRKLKHYILNFKLLVHRKSQSKWYVIFENSLKSNYLPWLNNIFTDNKIGIIELRPKFSFIETDRSNKKMLQNAEVLLFHSPGEVLQNKLINSLLLKERRPILIGFQHGFVGVSMPLELNYVLSRTIVDIFLCYEKSFERMVRSYIGNKTVFLKSNEIKKYVVKRVEGLCDIYFDAPDRQSIIATALKLSKLCKQNKLNIATIYFHPITSIIKRWIVLIILKNLNFNLKTKQAIVWDSKVKFNLFDNEYLLYTLDDSYKLKRLVKTSRYSDLNYSLNKFIKNDLEDILIKKKLL